MTHEPPPAQDARPQKMAKPNPPQEDPKAPIAPVESTAPAPIKDLTKVSLNDFVSGQKLPVPLDPTTITSDTVTELPAEQLAKFRDAVSQRNFVCILLAAGQGTRFVSDVPKVIHPFAGKPLAQHAIDAAAAAEIPVVVIVGYAKEKVVPALSIAEGHAVAFVQQEKQMGTGHAVYIAKYALPEKYEGSIAVSYADNPGVDTALLNDMTARHKNEHDSMGEPYGATVLTGSRKAAGQGAEAYGRIVRKEKDGGRVVDIVEKKTFLRLAEEGKTKTYDGVEWTAKELEEVDEFNSGIVCARAKPYLEVLGKTVASQTKMDPPKYEYYATDFVKGLYGIGKYTEGYELAPEDIWKLEGANTVEELKEFEKKLEERNNANNGDAPREPVQAEGQQL